MVQPLLIFTGLIPRFVPVKAIAVYLRICSIPIPKRIRKAHLQNNRSEWRKVQKQAMSGRYIERQHLLTGLRFGNVKASYNCCEAIAAMNAVIAFNAAKEPASKAYADRRRIDFPAVLEAFESYGLVLGGVFGTATDMILRFFADRGYASEQLWGRSITEAAAEEMSKNCKAFVLTMYNDKTNIFAQVHTVCITRTANRFEVHNAGIPGRRFASLYEAIRASHREKGKEILLVGIK